MESKTRAPYDATLWFAQQLAALRASADFPSFRALEKRPGLSRSALNDAIFGRKLPTYDTAQVLVEPCGGSWEELRPLWQASREQSASSRSARLAQALRSTSYINDQTQGVESRGPPRALIFDPQ